MSAIPIRSDINFEVHNAEAQAVWEAYHEKKPVRVPLRYSLNPRMILMDPALNFHGYTFKDYLTDFSVQLQIQVEFHYWRAHNIQDDSQMGLPDEWPIFVDFQNCDEASWFGAEIIYPTGQANETQPTCTHLLTSDAKRLLFDKGIPEPVSGPFQLAMDYLDFLTRKREEGFEYQSRPVAMPELPGEITDGAFTLAAAMRGATEMCIDIYEDPEYVHELLAFITEATIQRIKAFRKLMGHEQKPTCWGFADDSIAMLSIDTYKEFVLPYHKKLLNELAGEGPHSVHLCGDATHLFPTIKDELNVKSYDTGFPVDFGWLREALGPEVTIRGGPPVACFLNCSPNEVAEEAKRILASGIMEGGKFILGEGNNIAPRTPLANMDAVYHAVREFGKY